MELRYILGGIFLAVGLIIFRRIFSNKAKKEYDAAYKEILTSDRYKVKGQFD